jgi:small subunit ribosomal protein S27e
MPTPKSRFLRVKCECQNEQVIFGNASTEIKCIVCDKVIAEPTGGRTKILTQILEVLE